LDTICPAGRRDLYHIVRQRSVPYIVFVNKYIVRRQPHIAKSTVPAATSTSANKQIRIKNGTVRYSPVFAYVIKTSLRRICCKTRERRHFLFRMQGRSALLCQNQKLL